jgi:hypothetical protein
MWISLLIIPFAVAICLSVTATMMASTNRSNAIPTGGSKPSRG